MTIEENVFKRREIDFNKLIDYGFILEDNVYKYTKSFMDNFKAVIIVDKNGNVSGKVYDLSLNEEYSTFRIQNQAGVFVNKVNNEYIKLLEDIKNKISKAKYFINDQSNRISSYIIDNYNTVLEFPWDKFPGYGVFKNKKNNKWFSLIFNININKLDKNKSGEIEGINLKIDSKKISELLELESFYPAYHMNKKYWITVILNDTVTDEELFSLIEESYNYTNLK